MKSKLKISGIGRSTILYGDVKFSFEDARKIARARGHESINEFLEYDCPGAYRIPKNPHEIYSNQFISWEDFLGITYTFDEARMRVKNIGIENEEDYIDRVSRGVDLRLPAIPPLKYKNKGWVGWGHFLSYCIEGDEQQHKHKHKQTSNIGNSNDENNDTDENDSREHFMYCHI